MNRKNFLKTCFSLLALPFVGCKNCPEQRPIRPDLKNISKLEYELIRDDTDPITYKFNDLVLKEIEKQKRVGGLLYS